MSVSKNRNKAKPIAEPVPELKMEGPLKEKDEQGLAAERARKLGEQALAQWRRLKQKIKSPFKK